MGNIMSCVKLGERLNPEYLKKSVKGEGGSALLEVKNIEIKKWLGQSSDLNPIENLWKILVNKVMATEPTTITELWKRLEEEWIKITPEQCEKLELSCGPQMC